MNRDMLDRIGERVDRIVTLDMRVRGAESPIIEKIYPAARNLYKRPISYFAAEKLFETVKNGDFVYYRPCGLWCCSRN
jgi:hypothetical protein